MRLGGQGTGDITHGEKETSHRTSIEKQTGHITPTGMEMGQITPEGKDMEVAQEEARQKENNKLRREFARHANVFFQRLTDTSAQMMEGSGTLEEQLTRIKVRYISHSWLII